MCEHLSMSKAFLWNTNYENVHGKQIKDVMRSSNFRSYCMTYPRQINDREKGSGKYYFIETWTFIPIPNYLIFHVKFNIYIIFPQNLFWIKLTYRGNNGKISRSPLKCFIHLSQWNFLLKGNNFMILVWHHPKNLW